MLEGVCFVSKTGKAKNENTPCVTKKQKHSRYTREKQFAVFSLKCYFYNFSNANHITLR